MVYYGAQKSGAGYVCVCVWGGGGGANGKTTPIFYILPNEILNSLIQISRRKDRAKKISGCEIRYKFVNRIYSTDFERNLIIIPSYIQIEYNSTDAKMVMGVSNSIMISL